MCFQSVWDGVWTLGLVLSQACYPFYHIGLLQASPAAPCPHIKSCEGQGHSTEPGGPVTHLPFQPEDSYFKQPLIQQN